MRVLSLHLRSLPVFRDHVTCPKSLINGFPSAKSRQLSSPFEYQTGQYFFTMTNVCPLQKNLPVGWKKALSILKMLIMQEAFFVKNKTNWQNSCSASDQTTRWAFVGHLTVIVTAWISRSVFSKWQNYGEQRQLSFSNAFNKKNLTQKIFFSRNDWSAVNERKKVDVSAKGWASAEQRQLVAGRPDHMHPGHSGFYLRNRCPIM